METLRVCNTRIEFDPKAGGIRATANGRSYWAGGLAALRAAIELAPPPETDKEKKP